MEKEFEKKQDYLTGRDKALLGKHYDTLWLDQFECFCEIEELYEGDYENEPYGGGVFVHKVFYKDTDVTDMLTKEYLEKLFDMWRKDIDMTEAQEYVLSQETTIKEIEEILTEKYYEN